MKVSKDMRTIIWNEQPIVRVEGMVMVRGDLGFTPYLGYDNSRVAIYESITCTDYLIYGYKIKDKSVVTLNVLIPPQMPFTKASPIFHHWLIGEQRMGLTFNGTADARSFDRGIRVALENLEKALSVNMSGTSSEEVSSSSPCSTDSFNLPTFDDIAVPDTHSIVSQSSALHSKPVPTSATFRPLAMSASSSRGLPTSQHELKRCHSTSVPGRPRRTSIMTENSMQSQPLVIETSTFSSNTTTYSSTTSTSIHSSCNQIEGTTRASTSSMADLVRPPPTYTRRHKSRIRSESSTNSQHRMKRTKTPNLDNLERQRDLKPTKPNSYVQIASNGHSTTRIGHSFLRSNSRASDGVHMAYSTTRFLAQRSAMYDYRYRGLIPSDESSHCDFSTTPLNPVSYPGSMKQASIRYESKVCCGKRKEDLGERSRCKNCQTMFNHDRNFPGSCPDAPPDNFRKMIDSVSCLCVPRCMFYYCDRDSEGNYLHEPCSCTHNQNGTVSKGRWIVLGLLSLIVPCLCFYPMLISCYKCGVACRCCGGRHEPVYSKNNEISKKT